MFSCSEFGGERCSVVGRLSKKSFDGFHMARTTSSLAVGRFAAKKGSLRPPRGRLVASLCRWPFEGNSSRVEMLHIIDRILVICMAEMEKDGNLKRTGLRS